MRSSCRIKRNTIQLQTQCYSDAERHTCFPVQPPPGHRPRQRCRNVQSLHVRLAVRCLIRVLGSRVDVKALVLPHARRTLNSTNLYRLSQGRAGQLCAGTLRSLCDLPLMRQVSWEAACGWVHACIACVRMYACMFVSVCNAMRWDI